MSLGKQLSSLAVVACTFAASVAAAQQPREALVGAGTSIIAIDLVTGGQTALPVDATNLLGIIDLAEEASGNLVLADVSGANRVRLPSGAVDPLAANGFGYGAIATGPTNDILATTQSALTASARVEAIDPVSGAAFEVVDAIPGAFASLLSGVAADASNNLYLSYLNVTELSGPMPTLYSLIARVDAGSSAPVPLVDSRDPGLTNNVFFEEFAFDGAKTLAASTGGEELYLIDATTGNATVLTNDGLLTAIRGLTFAPNGDALAIDAANGIVRLTNPGGVQTAVPNSFVSNPNGIIVYVPEPTFAFGLGFGALGLISASRKGRRRI